MFYDFYIWEQQTNDVGFWKFLCRVLDNEARGFLERLLESQSFKYKAEKRVFE